MTDALGFDLGGTGLRAFEPGNAEAVAAIAGTPGSKDRQADTIELIAQFAAQQPGRRYQTVAIGMSGFALLGIKPIAMAAEINRFFGASRVLVTSDMVTGHYSHFGTEPGACLVAGTGALAFGVSAEGVPVRIDGLGAAVGDRGSGYWMGRTALRAAVSSLELAADRTLLELIEAEIGEYQSWPLKFGTGELATAQVAKLAPVVLAAAEGGNPAAGAVVAEAAELLAASALACARAVAVESIAFGGGLFDSAGGLLAQMFSARVLTSGLTVEPMRNAPGLGAAAIAANPDSDRIAKLEAHGQLAQQKF